MLTHLFTCLPVGAVGDRVNLPSAVFGVLAVAYAVGLVLSRRVVATAAGTLVFEVSGLFWSEAVIAEVYALHVLFLALALLVLLLRREKRGDGYLLLAAFVIGLSMSHRHTSGLLLPGATLFVLLVERRKVLEWRLISYSAGLFLVGLLPHAYLPLRARMEVEEDGLAMQHRSPLGYMRMVEGRREDIGLRRFSGSLEEKVARAEARDRPIYALIPKGSPPSRPSSAG